MSEKRYLNIDDFDPNKDNKSHNNISIEEHHNLYIKKKKGWFVILMWYVCISLIGTLIILIANKPSDSDEATFWAFVGQLIGTCVFLFVCFWRLPDLRKNIFQNLDFKKNKKEATRNMILFLAFIPFFYALTFALNTTANLTSKMFSGEWLSGTSENQKILEDFIKDNIPIALLLIVIFGPIAEEITFRYGIFNINKNRKWAIFWSSTFFAFIHISTPIIYGGGLSELYYFPIYWTGGITFATLYDYTNDSILHSSLLHTTTNLISFIIIVALI